MTESGVLHAAAMADLQPAAVQTLVLVGSPTVSFVRAAGAALPALGRIVVCAGGDEAETLPSRIERWAVHRVEVDNATATVPSAYVALARCLWTHRSSLASTIAVLAPGHEQVSAAVLQGLDALLVNHGRHVTADWLPGTGTDGIEFIRTWADALLTQEQPLQALRLYDALRLHGGLDPALAVRLMKAWCALEQPARALEWLPACQMSAPEARATAADLEGVAHEQATAQRECWAANAEHLRRHTPALHDALRSVTPAAADLAWLLHAPWRLHMGQRERPVMRQEYPLLLRRGVGIPDVNAPEAPFALFEALSRTGDVMQMHAVIGDLTRFDAFLNVMANPAVSRVPNRRQVVYGLIPDLAMFRRFAEVQDLRALIVPSRIELLWGADAAEQLVDVFRQHRGRPTPGVLTGGAEALRSDFDRVSKERFADYEAAAEVVARYDVPDLPARVLAKLERREPLKIWTWSSRHTTVLQFVVRDLKAAFETLGHRLDVLIEDDERDLVDKLAMQSSLASSQPDVLLFLDHFRPQFWDLVPRHPPTIAWFLDEIPQMRDPAQIRRLGAYDLTFSWNRGIADMLQSMGYPHIEPLAFAANPTLYGAPPDGDGAAADDTIAFITHLAAPQDEKFARGFVAAFRERVETIDPLPSGWLELGPIVDEIIVAERWELSGHQRETLMCIANAAGRHLDRLRIARALVEAGLPLACYGRGWTEEPEFRPFARGVIPPGAALRDAYRRHRVVLHVNIRCNVHPRVLETMLAGGFVLARSDGGYDRSPGGTADAFDLDHELCLFDSLDDLVRKAQRAFDEPKWRQGFIDAGRARVLASHTYEQRAATMLARLQQVLQAAVRDEAIGRPELRMCGR